MAKIIEQYRLLGKGEGDLNHEDKSQWLNRDLATKPFGSSIPWVESFEQLFPTYLNICKNNTHKLFH